MKIQWKINKTGPRSGLFQEIGQNIDEKDQKEALGKYLMETERFFDVFEWFVIIWCDFWIKKSIF